MLNFEKNITLQNEQNWPFLDYYFYCCSGTNISSDVVLVFNNLVELILLEMHFAL